MVSDQVEFKKGDKIRIEIESVVGDSQKLCFNPISVCKQFEIGDKIQVDFNHVRFEITKKSTDHYLALVVNGGSIGSNKAADVNRDLTFDPLTEKDRQAIEMD
jgi:pyruvate kinase